MHSLYRIVDFRTIRSANVDMWALLLDANFRYVGQSGRMAARFESSASELSHIATVMSGVRTRSRA